MAIVGRIKRMHFREKKLFVRSWADELLARCGTKVVKGAGMGGARDTGAARCRSDWRKPSRSPYGRFSDLALFRIDTIVPRDTAYFFATAVTVSPAASL